MYAQNTHTGYSQPAFYAISPANPIKSSLPGQWLNPASGG
ncbi:MAG: hypothetical protein [Podoviridae sp. cty5g4]|nr:MAG: hypothetical protein [Podoviridae sp. cty5g4]